MNLPEKSIFAGTRHILPGVLLIRYIGEVSAEHSRRNGRTQSPLPATAPSLQPLRRTQGTLMLQGSCPLVSLVTRVCPRRLRCGQPLDGRELHSALSWSRCHEIIPSSNRLVLPTGKPLPQSGLRPARRGSRLRAGQLAVGECRQRPAAGLHQHHRPRAVPCGYRRLGLDLRLRAIKTNIADSLNVVIHVERRPGRRFVSEVLEINGYNPDADLFDYCAVFQKQESKP